MQGEPGVAATIGVDTLRATAADLEQAFLAAQLLSPTAPGGTGSVMGEATAAAKLKNGADSRAAKHLKKLLSAPETDSKPFGRGRTLEIEVDVRDGVSKRSM
jgi:hypothetical protein